MPDGRISTDPVATSLSGTDFFPIVQSSTNKRCSFSTLYGAVFDGKVADWRVLASLPTRGDAETFLTGSTGGVTAGLPVRYVCSGTTYYGIVAAVTTNASFRIVGAPIPSNPSEVSVGDAARVVTRGLILPGSYATGSTLLATAGQYLVWRAATAYLCGLWAVAKTVTGSDSRINVYIGSDLVSTGNSGDGVKLTAGGTWVENGVAIDSSKYDAQYGEAIELRCATNGGSDLNVSLAFVIP